MDLYRRFPSHKWVYFSDDDTFVYVRNLLSRLGHYDHDKDFYLGLYWTPRVDMEWKEVHIAYASGGAGYALSRALLSRMSTTMRTCHKNYRRWAGDVRVGKCVLDLGVQITPEVGFHHEPHDKYTWDMSGGGFPYLHLSNRASAGITAPVSFHHLTVDQMHMYYRMQMADERGPRGELFRYDFAPQLFKEFMAFSPTLGYSFRVLFGVSVEVAHADHRASPPQWRRDFGDPLYLRRAVDPNGGAQQPLRFHMVIAKVPEIFHGDGCSAVVDDPFRLPLRKAAVIAVQCAPCKRLDAPADEPPGYNRICDAWKEDECTLKILLSLSCPARQVVHAPALDVGSTRNGHDLVFRGQATACAEPSRLLRPYEHADPSRPAILHISLKHGDLSLDEIKFYTSPAWCTASIVHGDLSARGTLLRHAAGGREIAVACTCLQHRLPRWPQPGQAHPRAAVRANVTVAIRPTGFTAAVFSYLQSCAVEPTRKDSSSLSPVAASESI